MSTLGIDFARGDRDKYTEAHLKNWLATRSSDPVQDEADICRAMESDPTLTEWADWPAIRSKGRWMRGKS